jgi:plastocyanin
MKKAFGLVSFLAVGIFLLAACQAAPAATQAPAAQPPAAPAGGSGAPVEILIQSFAFSPQSVTIPVGTEVKWTNQDTPGHNIVSDDGTTIKSPTLGTGESFSMVFDTPGTYTYICSIHPKMKGTIIVTK